MGYLLRPEAWESAPSIPPTFMAEDPTPNPNEIPTQCRDYRLFNCMSRDVGLLLLAKDKWIQIPPTHVHQMSKYKETLDE